MLSFWKKRILNIFLYAYLFLNASGYAADFSFTDNTTVPTADSSGDRYIFNGDNLTLTVPDGVTLGSTATQAIINANTNSPVNPIVVVESGAVVTSSTNTIQGKASENLIITNSGTISTNTTRAINLLNAQTATITNNSGGIISSNTGNTINGDETGTTDGNTISNSGTIFSTDGIAIRFISGTTSTNITNNSGGIIYNDSTEDVVRLGGSSTLINSGTIQNKNSPSNDSIDMIDSNNTVTLKNGGKVIGIIRSTGSNNTLQLNHGVGQSYFYETAGNDMTLTDLDGNQVVQGSASSVGQGGTETIDEILGYKSINIRNFINNYKNTQKSNSVIENGWGQTFGSFLKRKSNKSNLALGYEYKNIGVNLIFPDTDRNYLLSFEAGRINFDKDHELDRLSFLYGIHSDQNNNNSKFYNEYFVIGGITLNNSKRTILTNTTTTGKQNINDSYESYEILSGLRMNNPHYIPNLGLTLNYSLTPNHDESNYFSWDLRQLTNLSFSLSDNFKIKKENSLFKLGWIIDSRALIFGNEQDYSINGKNVTYKQDNDLTHEVSFVANAGYTKYLNNNSSFNFSIDGKLTTQNTSSLSGFLGYDFSF